MNESINQMSDKNKQVVMKLIETVSKEENNSYLNHLAEDIKWDIVGMPIIKGKEEFIEMMKELNLENFTTNKIRNVISAGKFVVVESGGINSGNNSCDIYQLKNGKIIGLTSYIVDASPVESAFDFTNNDQNK